MTHLVMVDLGKLSDYTAILVSRFEQRIRRIDVGGPRNVTQQRVVAENHYGFVLGERPELYTSYGKIVKRVELICARVAQTGDYTLVVDATGVGEPVVDRIREAGLAPIAIYITPGSHRVTRVEEEVGDGQTRLLGYRVPKSELVSNMLVVLQERRARFSEDIPEEYREAVRQEMRNFRMKLTKKGHEKFEAWREGDSDDIVLSAAIGLWVGETMFPAGERLVGVGEHRLHNPRAGLRSGMKRVVRPGGGSR